ncbi:MAG TPA: hypothetical protein PL033_12225 [Candidatus Brocadiia bacterium]|nr:hypothetical protein [Candidatus Brocadiia bacterium]
MAGGYVTDGETLIGLGDYAFAAPDYSGGPLAVESAAEVDLRYCLRGGDAQLLRVQCEAIRANAGDAERWLIEKLLALSETGIADVGIEDYAGGRVVFSGCWFVGGSGRVEANSEAKLLLRFIRPAHDLSVSDNAWESIPAEAETYEGTTTGNLYLANGIQLGDYATMKVEAARRTTLKRVPRCNGARIAPLIAGRRIRFTLDCVHSRAGSRTEIEAYLRDIHKGIGPGPVALAGNGNSWSDCRLERIASTPNDHWGICKFKVTFVHTPQDE